MGKTKKLLIYVSTVIILFLIIPEVILRVLTPEQLARMSDFTSLGGAMNPLLSLIIFLGLFSVVLAFLTVSAVSKIYRSWSRPESK
jgi:hypothetical protein